jgi:hypothetical protein
MKKNLIGLMIGATIQMVIPLAIAADINQTQAVKMPAGADDWDSRMQDQGLWSR